MGLEEEEEEEDRAGLFVLCRRGGCWRDRDCVNG
jgi:hypothetical protein